MSAGAEALDFIRGGVQADVMLLDIRMPIMSGLEVMAEVAASPPPYPIVWCSSDCPLPRTPRHTSLSCTQCDTLPPLLREEFAPVFYELWCWNDVSVNITLTFACHRVVARLQ